MAGEGDGEARHHCRSGGVESEALLSVSPQVKQPASLVSTCSASPVT